MKLTMEFVCSLRAPGVDGSVAERAADLGTVRRPLRRFAMGGSDVRQLQSDLHVGVPRTRE
jgi:hypothetical protein